MPRRTGIKKPGGADILQLLTYATSYNMLPAVRDLDVPVLLVNLQKKKAPDYANTDTATWLGQLYACAAASGIRTWPRSADPTPA